jgi:hypothetical protein
MIALLFALVIGTSTPQPIRVDVVEVNEYVDRNGNHVLRQALLRRWLRLSHGNGHFVEEWRLVQGEPQPFWRAGKRFVSMQTSDGIIVVEARSYRETRTTYDPELLERGIYPQEQRRAYLGEAQ